MRRVGARMMLSLVALLASLVAGAVGPVAAQSDEQSLQTSVPDVSTIKAKKLKFGKTKVDDWTVHHDRRGDVRRADGVIFPEAADFTDITRVLITENNVPGKLPRVWERNYPLGTASAYRGEQAEIRKKIPYVWLIVETAASPPRNGDPAVQLLVSAYGPDGQPLAPATSIEPGNGTVQFSRSGLFNGGNFGSGTTERAGLPAGASGDVYNIDARDFGRFERKKNRIFHAAFVPKGTRFISVTLETSQDGTQLFDELELPVGGTLFDLADNNHGSIKGEDPVVCRDVWTRMSPPGLAGVDDPADTIWLEANVQLRDGFDLSALDAATDTVSLVPADGSDTPVDVEGTWMTDATSNTATIRAALPGGSTRWSLDPASTPDEGSLIAELSPYLPLRKALLETIGDGSFEARPDLLGRLGGARGCARFQFAETACDAAEAGDLASIIGLDPSATSYNRLTTTNGIDVCGGIVAGADAPSFILARRDEPADAGSFAAQVAASACPSTPFGSTGTQFVLDCSANGFESLWTLVTPDRAVEAGYVASLDVASTDGSVVSEAAWRGATDLILAAQEPTYGAWIAPPVTPEEVLDEDGAEDGADEDPADEDPEE